MSYKKVLYRKRDFLNSNEFHSLAAMFGEIVAEWGNKDDMNNGLPPIEERVTFNITDCTRKIDLQFDTKTSDGLDNSLQKISKLANFVNEFKDQLYVLAETLEGRKELKEMNNLMDTLYNKFDKWFDNNTSNDTKLIYELERSESYNFILWVDDSNALTKSYRAELKSFVNTLEEEFEVNIVTYFKNFEL